MLIKGSSSAVSTFTTAGGPSGTSGLIGPFPEDQLPASSVRVTGVRFFATKSPSTVYGLMYRAVLHSVGATPVPQFDDITIAERVPGPVTYANIYPDWPGFRKTHYELPWQAEGVQADAIERATWFVQINHYLVAVPAAVVVDGAGMCYTELTWEYDT